MGFAILVWMDASSPIVMLCCSAVEQLLLVFLPPGKTVGRKFDLINFNLNWHEQGHDEGHGLLTTWEVPRGSSPWKINPLCMS